jgi:cyclophilin family peptidyl-prolyl cis-trans isomerase
MCQKFASLCSGKDGPGYRGSSIFKVVKNYSITGGFVESKTDKEWRRKFFYIADRSSLPEKRGCVRMHINRIVDWKAEVSTEFLIILTDRMEQRKFTTVFGHVVEGLAVCEKISQLNLEKMNIVIAECGPC